MKKGRRPGKHMDSPDQPKVYANRHITRPGWLSRKVVLLIVPMVALLGVGAILFSHAQGTSTVSGNVFNDANRNGVLDAGETPFADIPLNIYDSAWNYVSAATTNSSGFYSIPNLANGTYFVQIDYQTWSAMRDTWVPTTTGSLVYQTTVTLSGTASANFGLRQIVRSTDVNSPITTYTGPNKLVVDSYDDVVTAQSIYSDLMSGQLIGPEAGVTTIYFDYGTNTDTATSVSGTQAPYSNFRAQLYIRFDSWATEGDESLFHEYGHAWSEYNAYMVQGDPTLTSYLQARGLLTNPNLGTNSLWEPDEIFAEDYRQLFGSANAASYPQANSSIPPASQVPGLKTFLQAVYDLPPQAALAAPTNLIAKAVAQNEIDLSWKAVTGASKYNVYRNGTLVGFTNSPSTVYADNNLTPSTSYIYSVKAVNSAGQLSAASAAVSAMTLASDTISPSAPANLTSPSQTGTSIALSWNPSTDNVGVTGYKVYQVGGSKRNSYSTLIATTTTTNYSVTGLSSATNYSYYVVAYDAAGNQSAPSNTLSTKTLRR